MKQIKHCGVVEPSRFSTCHLALVYTYYLVLADDIINGITILFVLGSKNCIGFRFAIAEMQVVLLTLLTQYHLKLTSNANVEPKLTGVTIKPTKLEMTVHRRA